MIRRTARWAALASMLYALGAVPAGAVPEDPAHRFGAAPGGTSFAVVAGRPTVAYVSHRAVRVQKLAGYDGTWRRVGGLVRHARGSTATAPDLIGGPDGQAWLTWIETAKGRWWEPQVRVATFAHGRWHEIGRGRRPINGPVFGRYQPTRRDAHPRPDDPSIVFYRGRPVVALSAYDGTGVSTAFAQLSRNGHSWHRLPRSGAFSDIAHANIAVAGGRLYGGGTCCWTLENDHLHAEFARLRTSQRSWQRFGTIDPNPLPPNLQEPVTVVGDVANVNGHFTVLWSRKPRDSDVTTVNVTSLGSGDRWVDVDPPLAQLGPRGTPLGLGADGTVAYGSYLTGNGSSPGVQVRRLIHGEWETLPSPTDAGYRGRSAQFAPASGRGMWLLSGERRGGGRTRYVLHGYSVTPPPQLPR